MQSPTLVISDIHGNDKALSSVLNHAPDDIEQVLCLGDIVGYGPAPGRCVDLLRDLDTAVKAVKGNHDAGVLDELPKDRFNPMAREANRWTEQQLTRDQLDWLRQLPVRDRYCDGLMVHGMPDDPLLGYLDRLYAARRAIQEMEASWLITGHTHAPVFYTGSSSSDLEEGSTEPDKTREVHFTEPCLVLNPGSVGQPRDGDPRSCYMLMNVGRGKIRWERCKYDRQSVQERIHDAGLPPKLASRLEHGV